MMRQGIRIVVILIAIAAVLGGYCVYRGASASLHAEHVLQSALFTVQLLDDYVTLHDGAWPKSWADLEGLSPRERAMFDWPRDSQELQKYVTVDFSADPRRIAKQTCEEFDAVRPIGPYYEFRDYGSVVALIEKIAARVPKE